MGRKRFLDEQLNPTDDPPSLTARWADFTIAKKTSLELVQDAEAENKRIDALKNDDDRQQARNALNQLGNEVSSEVARRHVLRALDSPAQLREQMVWFWANHFSVYSGKAALKWTVGDYEELAIRPHALGHFADLVLATLESGAMMQYLDNAQSAANKLNENYARELLELHTLGVAGGYSQQDVQELARVLTGAGYRSAPDAPKLDAKQGLRYRRLGLFEFNPARHDQGSKTILGRTFEAGGLDEIEAVVRFLCEQPATAKFVSHKLAAFFIADEPPPAIEQRMVAVFQKTHGDIAAVLRVIFESKDVTAHPKLKDPMHFVISAIRLAYEDKYLTNFKPVLSWLNQLGEPLYGRTTPDGYGLTAAGWLSSGQMVKRFEIAKSIGSGNAGLFDGEGGKPSSHSGFPVLMSRLFYDSIERSLSDATTVALARASSQAEWNTFLLSSYDFMER